MLSPRAAVRAAALPAALAVALIVSAAPGIGQAPPVSGTDVALLVMPEIESVKLFGRRPFALGLGAFPDSRDPMRFLQEMGNGAPRGSDGGEVVRFSEAIGGVAYGGETTGYLSLDPLIDTFISPRPPRGPPRQDAGRLEIRTYGTAIEAERFVLGVTEPTAFVVVGLGDRTPVRVGICEPGCSRGILTGGITRRPGIVTPYDLSVTMLDRLGATPIPGGFVGNVLTSEPDPDASAGIEALERRLERDDTYAPGLAAVAVGLGGLLVIFGALLGRRGLRAIALRLAQAAVFVLPGWVLGIFIPSEHWGVRAIPIVAGALLGAALRPRDPIRTLARVGFGSAVAFAFLVAIAPLNPGGEPGLSIWGNPLVSWRFFGMQNVEAAIIASGVVVWGVLAGLAAPVLAVFAVAAAIITGAPAVGANFVGVLTFVFGAAVAISMLVRRRAAVGQIVVAGVLGAGAFALALLADAGSPVSHGGRAARRISSGGWSAAWDLIEGRVRLNRDLILDFSGGVVFVAVLLVALVAMIAWGLRVDHGPLRGRAAVLAGSLMALSSLVLEDSGFYSGAVLWFVAADAWLLVMLAPTRPVIPPENAAQLAGAG